MCTAMSLSSKQDGVIFGRTMDFSYELDPEIYVVPKGYEWQDMGSGIVIKNSYRFIGTGQNIGKIVFADGMNECGLGVAVLYFPGYASFDGELDALKTPISSLEIVSYLLGNCGSVKDVMETIRNVQIIGVKDPVTNSVAPLHWIVTDKSGSTIAIEKTINGTEIINDPVGVLSNSPGLLWHLTNLRNYANLSPYQKEESHWNNLVLTPFGQGAGTQGLPGDYTPPSRFVRVAYQKTFLMVPDSIDELINDCFTIMGSVTIPKGIVMTNRNTPDYTQYTVFMNLNTGNYYFNTYRNKEIKMVNINDALGDEIISLGKLKRPFEIKHL